MAECDLWNPPLSNKEVEQLSDLEGVSDGPLRWTVRTVLADRAYWKEQAEKARAENAKLVESRRCWRMEAVGFGGAAKMYKAKAEKWEARHAALVRASSPILRFLHSNITHPLCPFCCGWKKHSATCGYKIWAALVEGEDDNG